jgi:hypothetical protein
VPPVERRDPRDPEPFGGADHRGIDHSESRVGVARDQLGDADPVRGSRRFDEERPGGEILEKAELDPGAEAALDEVRDLCEDERGNDQRAGIRAQELGTRDVVVICNVEIRVERAGVYERSGRPSSSASSSSIRRAVSR